MSNSKKATLRIKLLLPEAWNFFTRDPREDRIYIYRVSEHKSILPINRWPNNSIRNLFGIKRDARAIGTDYGMILAKVSDSLWVKTTENTFSKIEAVVNFHPQFEARYPDDINGPKHFLYGDLLFVKKQIKPWSWFRLNIESDDSIKYMYGSIKETK